MRPKTFAALVLCLATAGCLMPNDYAAEITIGRDRSYAGRFEGDIVHLPILAGNEAEPAAGLPREIAETAGLVSATRKARGTYAVAIDGRGTLAEGMTPLPGPAKFLIVVLRDGEAVVATPDLNAHQLKQLSAYGTPSVGEVCIRTDAEVLSHNAERVPADPSGCYGWSLDLLAGERIRMRLRM